MPFTLKVRPAQEADYDQWYKLWQDYIDFYEDNVPEHVTKATWSRILDENNPIYGDVVEIEGKVVGLATSIIHEATWSEKPVCYQKIYMQINRFGEKAVVAL